MLHDYDKMIPNYFSFPINQYNHRKMGTKRKMKQYEVELDNHIYKHCFYDKRKIINDVTPLN